MSIKRILILALCSLLLAFSVWQVYAVDTAMQYIALSPTEEPIDPEHPSDSAMLTLVKNLKTLSEDWTGIIKSFAITTQNEDAALNTKDDRSATAHLTGLYGSPDALKHQALIAGRLLYPEELIDGDNVIVLDEQLAIKLFRIGDPLERVVILDGVEYRVIGIVRHSRAVGDSTEYGAYVPLMSLDKTRFQTATVTVSARGVPGAGAQAMFKTQMESWKSGGMLYVLAKEQYRAMLPLRILAALIACVLLYNVFQWLKKFSLWMYHDYQERLSHRFAAQMVPRAAMYIGLGIVLYALLIGACYLLFLFIIDPVYMFPEWIPAVLVEWTDINATFWQNRTDATHIIALRSPEVMTLSFWQGIISALCIGMGALLLQWYGYHGKKKE